MELKTLEPGKVKMYVCGPTTYNYIHLGNARPIVVFDTIRDSTGNAYHRTVIWHRFQHHRTSTDFYIVAYAKRAQNLCSGANHDIIGYLSEIRQQKQKLKCC